MVWGRFLTKEGTVLPQRKKERSFGFAMGVDLQQRTGAHQGWGRFLTKEGTVLPQRKEERSFGFAMGIDLQQQGMGAHSAMRQDSSFVPQEPSHFLHSSKG